MDLSKPLPPTNTTARQVRGFRIATFVFGAVAVVGLAVMAAGDDLMGVMLLVPGAVFSFGSGAITLVMRHYGNKAQEEIEQLEQGRFLVHWIYPPEVWNRHVEAEQAGESFSTYAPWVGGPGLFLGLLFGWLVFPSDIIGLVASALAGAALFLAIAWAIAHGVRQRYPRTRRPVQLYLTQGSAFYHRCHVSWAQLGTGLEDVRLNDGFLELRISIQGGKHRYTHEFRFPIPEGRREEAANAVAELSKLKPHPRSTP